MAMAGKLGCFPVFVINMLSRKPDNLKSKLIDEIALTLLRRCSRSGHVIKMLKARAIKIHLSIKTSMATLSKLRT